MNNKFKKLAVAILAVSAMSGCASTQVNQLARPDVPPAANAEPQVSRPLNSYGTMGGYRYRRFAAVAATS